MNEEELTLLEDPINFTDIKVVHEPEIQKPTVATQLHSEETDPGVSHESVQTDGFDVPIILLNQQVLGDQHIKSMELRYQDFLPTLELVVEDEKDDIQYIGGPGMRNRVVVILVPPNNGIYRSIALPFYITKRLNETTTTIKYICEYHNLGLTDVKCMQVGSDKMTTYEFCEKISKLIGLGFACTQQCKEIQDKRYRQMYSQRVVDFIQEQIKIGGTGEDSFFDAWIDTHGYLCLSNLSWLFEQDVKPKNLSVTVKPDIEIPVSTKPKNEPFDVQRTLVEFESFPINNLRIRKKYNYLLNKDSKKKGTDTSFWILKSAGDQNILEMQDIQMEEDNLEGKGEEAKKEYTFKKTVFLGCEMAEDGEYMIQEQKRDYWLSKRKGKGLVVELERPNYGLERGTFINVGIIETDPKKIRMISQNFENVTKKTKKENEPYNVNDNAEPANLGDATNGNIGLTNPALSGMYYIDGMLYKYDKNIGKVMQVLFLIKKSDDNNLFHAEASPNITTEQQDALDANIGRVIEENGGGKSAESVSN